MMRRMVALLLFAGLVSGASAQLARAPELEAWKKRLSASLRAEVPEVTIRRVDSLLALPAFAGDPAWRTELLGYRAHAKRLQGRYEGALADQFQAYAIADSADDRLGRIDALLGIANVHMDLGLFDRAAGEVREVYRMVQATPVSRGHRVYLAMGTLADLRQQGDSALYWLDLALPLMEADRDSFGLADLHYNIGITLGGQGRMAESEKALRRALAVVPASGYPQLEARATNALSYLCMQQGRMDEVPALLDRSERLAEAYGVGEVLANVKGDRIMLALAAGDSAQALHHIDRLLAVKDSLARMMRQRTIAESQARFGAARLEKELSIAKAQAEGNSLRAQRAWIAWGAAAVIALLTGVLVRLFIRQAQLRKAMARVLQRDKERLEVENEQLHQENLMARFETLKSQIDPHFLFNVMNTLYTLVGSEPAKAREFIASFSALYRKVLGSRERTIVPVQEELELVRHYLFLQRIRFGDSLQVSVDVPAKALQAYLPPFTLQMLLENAIKHNAISAARPLGITIAVEDGGLVVRNDLRPRGTSEAGTGTGLENIRRRYLMLGATEPVFRVAGDRYEARVPLLTSEP